MVFSYLSRVNDLFSHYGYVITCIDITNDFI
nr:MAG TPA: hypothetical protein [Herelleviridae sp.]